MTISISQIDVRPYLRCGPTIALSAYQCDRISVEQENEVRSWLRIFVSTYGRIPTPDELWRHWAEVQEEIKLEIALAKAKLRT